MSDGAPCGPARPAAHGVGSCNSGEAVALDGGPAPRASRGQIGVMPSRYSNRRQRPRTPHPLRWGRRCRAVALSLLASMVLILHDPAASPAGDDLWREIARDQDVVVYEHRDGVGDVPARRAVGVIDAAFYDVLAVLTDVERQVEWLPRCRVARVLKREGDRVTYVYSRTDVPWPAADRDAVTRSEIDLVEPGRLAFIRFTSAGAAGLVDAVPGVVRATRLEGHYRLAAVGAARTHVEYQIDADLGGRLPRAVIDWATRQVPLASLLGLRRQVARARGAPARVAAGSAGPYSLDHVEQSTR